MVVGVLLLGWMMVFGMKKAEAETERVNATIGIYQENKQIDGGKCYGPCYSSDKEVTIEAFGVTYNGKPIQDQNLAGNVNIEIKASLEGKSCFIKKFDESGYGSCSISPRNNLQFGDSENKKIEVTALIGYSGTGGLNTRDNPIKNANLLFQYSCDEIECSITPMSREYELCDQIPTNKIEERDRCYDCFSKEGIWTAVGCISNEPSNIISTIIEIGMVIAGGVVLIIIFVASFMLSTSQGDPNKTKEAKELITSAIVGLLFIIFSITILQFIGVSILHIPGFGE